MSNRFPQNQVTEVNTIKVTSHRDPRVSIQTSLYSSAEPVIRLSTGAQKDVHLNFATYREAESMLMDALDSLRATRARDLGVTA
jgi:hypothetical protein